MSGGVNAVIQSLYTALRRQLLVQTSSQSEVTVAPVKHKE